MMKKAVLVAVAAAALAAPAALAAATTSLAQNVVACVYDSGKCSPGSLDLAAGQTVSFTKQQLADACKSGGYAAVGTGNQGRCVSFVETTLSSGVTVVGVAPSGGVEGLRSDGNGGLIANIYSDGNGGLIANLTSDGNGGLIAN